MAGPYTNEGLMQDEVGQPHILALGDSWFWYPANNLLIPIWNLWAGNKVVLAQGFAGAKAVQLASGNTFASFRSSLRSYSRIEAVLLSAGGNDFAGTDDMLRILRPDCSATASGPDCFDPDKITEVLFGEVLDAYRRMIDAVLELRPAALVYVHNYDYAIPTGKGIFGFGGWLKIPLSMVHVPEDVQPPAVNFLIDTFSDVLVQVQREYASHVLFVDSTGVLARTDWANELHPKMAGFNKLVAQAWQQPLLDNLP